MDEAQLKTIEKYPRQALLGFVVTALMIGAPWTAANFLHWKALNEQQLALEVKQRTVHEQELALARNGAETAVRIKIDGERIAALEADNAQLRASLQNSQGLVERASTVNQIRERQRAVERAMQTHVETFAKVDLSEVPPCDQLALYEQADASLDLILTLAQGLPDEERYKTFVNRRHGVGIWSSSDPRCIPNELLGRVPADKAP